MGAIDITWHEVLRRKGIESSIVESLIGFISWKKNEIYPRLGQEITDVLKNHTGQVIALDVSNDLYHHQGIVFFNRELSEDIASQIFSEILDYEYQEVYNSPQ
ncbi:MAG: hypothetical protein AB2421_16265 [Thermotaleaceae bacterium]